jgi:hypothetical protein
MDFKTQLAEYIHICQSTEFEWGKFDCCLFVSDFVWNTTGKDLAENFRGQYKSEEEAYELLKNVLKRKKSLKNVLLKNVEKTANKHNFKEVKDKRYQSGDFCVVNTPQGEAMGLIHNGKVWCSAPKGLVTLPISLVIKVWRTTCHQ